MSKIDDVARGLLIDAFITYAAICREKGYGGEESTQHAIAQGLAAWCNQLSEMREKVMLHAGVFTENESSLEQADALIEERRGLIRDTMREEMADLEAAGPSAEDVEGIRDGEQG